MMNFGPTSGMGILVFSKNKKKPGFLKQPGFWLVDRETRFFEETTGFLNWGTN